MPAWGRQGEWSVTAALIQAGVPPWRETGEPVPENPLPAELLRKLYQELGLSLFDIELLTARTSNTVREDLVAADIPVRPRLGYPVRGGSNARTSESGRGTGSSRRD